MDSRASYNCQRKRRKRGKREREREAEKEREGERAKRVRAAARADSKQSNQSWLNELLIISRIRQSGEGNCPYNGGAKCARPTVCKCGEKGGW